MNYEIIGNILPLVQLTLNAGEKVKSQVGAMKWMDADIIMKTGMSGGIGGFIKRGFMGESGFLNTFVSEKDGSRIAFGHTYPGKILPLKVSEISVICQKRAFLLSEESVKLDIAFQKRLGTGFFGGEGFIMQKLHGTGMAFVEIDGEVVEMSLQAGQKIKVETGAVAMYEETVSMSIDRVKGVKNMLFGGEGLFLTSLTGPGKIWLQTMCIQSLATELKPYLIAKNSK